MRFMGGYYAFPGRQGGPGRRDRRGARALPGPLARRRRRGSSPPSTGSPPLAFWVTAARELLEETACCSSVCRRDGRAVDVRRARRGRAGRAACGTLSSADAAPFASLLAARGLVSRPRALPLPLALHHAALEPDPLHRALLPGPGAARTGSRCTATRRPPRASGSIPPRAIAASVAGEMPMAESGGERARLPLRVRQPRRAVGRARGRPPQVPRHPRPSIGRAPVPGAAARRGDAGLTVDNAAAAFVDAADRGGPGRRDGAGHARRARHLRRAARPGRPRGPRAPGARRRARAAGRAAPAGRPRLRRGLLRRAQDRRGGGPAQYAARRPGTSRAILADCRAARCWSRIPRCRAREAGSRGLGRERRRAAEWSGARAAARPSPSGSTRWPSGSTPRAPPARPRRPCTPTARSWPCRHYGGDVLGVARGDRVFATSKLFFAYALGNALLIPLLARGERVSAPGLAGSGLGGRGDARAIAPRSSSRCRPSTPRCSAPTCPPIPSPPRAPASPRASGCPPRSTRPGGRASASRSSTASGATETIFMVLSNRPGESRAGSTGVPVPGTEARAAATPPVMPVADGEQGVLWVRTPSLATGY